MTMTFEPATIPDEIQPDTVPDLSDVEYPCVVCNKESGPYGGRGRKPTRCPEHKKATVSGSKKLTGNAANLAAQATQVLVQVNGMLAVGAMGMQMFKTAHAIADANPAFEQQAHQALLTDPELCRLILKSGGASAKMSLAMAYVGMGMAILPTALQDVQERHAVRAAKKAEKDAATGA
jgi:hypothetical protein